MVRTKLHNFYAHGILVSYLIEPVLKLREVRSLKGPKEGQVLCLRCNGSGSIIDPLERPDPVEGYKLAGYIDCYECGSFGIRDEAYELKIHEDDRIKYEADIIKFNSDFEYYKLLTQSFIDSDHVKWFKNRFDRSLFSGSRSSYREYEELNWDFSNLNIELG